ncbi:hypothetical protein WMY93_026823 [Mugilogobius chulae]|uniref:ribonuclease H n=1 Tax=Mugilogobius chulae TaxID=88201 RepID=A0AAW0NB88_9GOBI
MGLYEFTRMPFGLSNAPATFQRLMHTCLGDQNLQSVLIYLDDVIIYSPDFDSHLAHLDSVLEKLERHGLKLKPDKCHFLRNEVQYLGHRVSAAGISPDPEKIKCVKEWPIPQTVKQLQSFLGLAGYYRRFVRDFAKIANPLNRLLTGISPKNSKCSGRQLLTWDETCTSAFETLKNALTSAPILAYADFNMPFVLYTDASSRGLGAVLCQVQDGKERVIAFASRTLSPSERNDQNYSSFKLEFLALTWAVTKKFAEYLYCAPFVVYTDNNPLVHLNSAKLGSLEQRWAARLASFQFDIKYKPGRTNQSADALSRFPPDIPTMDSEEAREGLEIPSFTHVGANIARAMCIGVGGQLDRNKEIGMAIFPERTRVQWQNLQNDDPVLAKVAMYVHRGYSPNRQEQLNESKETLQILRHWDRLMLIEGVLHRKRYDPKEMDSIFQILLPEGHPEDVYHNVLVMVDHFTKFGWAVPTKDQTATTTAKVLFSKVVQQFGAPKRLLSDQGPNFESHLFKELCNLYGISKSHTTPYHPAGNGACERLNRTLLGLLGTLGEERRNWHEHLPELMQDRLLGLSENVSCLSVENWVTCHQKRLHFALEKARKQKDTEMARQKVYHDRQSAPSILQSGQKVLLQDTRAKGRGKLANKWEETPYLVVKQPDPNLPVYVIQQEGSSYEKVVHGNLLRPLTPTRPSYSEPHLNCIPESRNQQGGPQPNTGPPWVGFWVPTDANTRGNPGPTTDPRAYQEAAEPRRSTRATRGVPPQRYKEV